MTPIPYLFFNGTCAEAMAFYVDIFDGEVVAMMPFSDLPPGEMDLPESAKGLIMHATIRIGDGHLMASDTITGGTEKMAGVSVNVSLPDVASSKAAFDKLAEGGEITMPYAATFWDPGFGTLVDKFGVHWMVGTDQPAES